jgi:broad specificity phosphatase PhoE
MKLYLLRHGQRGHGPEMDTLVPEGIKQSEKTAEYLKKLKIDKVICGDSNRARKTAEPFLKDFKGKVEYTPEVNEQDMGIFQGKSKSEWDEAVKKSGLSEKEFRPESGESSFDAYERARKFIESLKKEKAENILVVSHSGFISDVSTILLNKAKDENINYKMQFCAITCFELDKDFIVKTYCINSTSHL